MSKAQFEQGKQGTANTGVTGNRQDSDTAGVCGEQLPAFLERKTATSYFVATGNMLCALDWLRGKETVWAMDVIRGGYVLHTRKVRLEQVLLLPV